MTQQLAELLNNEQADPATLQHAVRYLVAELSDDEPPTAMHERLEQEVADGEALARLLDRLARDGELLELLDLGVLQAAWDDPTLQEAVRGAVMDAKAKLPVVEVGLIALVAVYGLWLVATKGRRRQERSIVRRPDGSYEERESIEWYGPTGPLEAIVRALGLGAGADGDAGALEEARITRHDGRSRTSTNR